MSKILGRVNEIIESYLCTFRQEKYKAKMDLTILQLKELRQSLENTEIRIEPYSQVLREEQNILTESTDNIYRILANGKHVIFVLTKGDKIVSISTMSKGDNGPKIFISLCDWVYETN